MFQFPTFAFLTEWLAFNQPGCPIRKSSDQWLFAPTRSLSQLITSFVASESQGIHRLPLLTFFIHGTLCAGLIYLQLALFCYFIFEVVQYVKDLIIETDIPVGTGLADAYPFQSVWRITDSNR